MFIISSGNGDVNDMTSYLSAYCVAVKQRDKSQTWISTDVVFEAYDAHLVANDEVLQRAKKSN